MKAKFEEEIRVLEKTIKDEREAARKAMEEQLEKMENMRLDYERQL